MAFDDVLRDVGDFGFYQKMLFMLLLVAGIDKGWQQMAMTFLGARMDHWCKTERLQNVSWISGHADIVYITWNLSIMLKWPLISKVRGYLKMKIEHF